MQATQLSPSQLMVENHKRRRSRNYATGGPQVSQDPVLLHLCWAAGGPQISQDQVLLHLRWAAVWPQISQDQVLLHLRWAAGGSVIIGQIKVMHVDRHDEEVQTRYLKRNDMRKTGAITFGWPATEDLAWHDNHNKDPPCDNTANNRVRSQRMKINRATKVYKEKLQNITRTTTTFFT